MFLLRRCHYFQPWCQSNNHRGNHAIRSIFAKNVGIQLEEEHQHHQTHAVTKSSFGTRRHRLPPQPMKLTIQLLGRRAFGERRFFSTYSSAQYKKMRKTRKELVKMNKIQTIGEASKTAVKYLHEFNSRNYSSFWSRVSRLATERWTKHNVANRELTGSQRNILTHQLNIIFFNTKRAITKFGPRDLAQTAHGLAKIVKMVNVRVSQGRRLDRMQQVFRYIIIGRQSSREEEEEDDIFQSIANVSLGILPEFEARYLSNLAYANAIASSVPTFDDGSTLFDHIAEKSIPLLTEFQPQELASLVWSFGKAGASNAGLFEKVADHIVSLDNIGEFKPLELSNILSAYAEANQTNSILFQKVADHIVSLDNLHTFRPEDLSNTVHAFAMTDEAHPRLFKTVSNRIITLGNLKSFKPHQLSHVLWAFSKAGESNPKLHVRIADHIYLFCKLELFEPSDLSAILLAFGKVEGSHRTRLFQKIADHMVEIGGFDLFEPHEISDVLEAYATADVIHPRLFARLHAHVNAHVESTSLGEDARRNLVWAYEKAEKAEQA